MIDPTSEDIGHSGAYTGNTYPGWMVWLFLVGNVLVFGGLLVVLVVFLFTRNFASASNYLLVTVLGGIIAHYALEKAEAYRASVRKDHQMTAGDDDWN